jgi:hypothetical protein
MTRFGGFFILGIDMRKFKEFSCLILCVLVGLMVGCSTFEKHIDTEKLIVQVATMKVIEVGDNAEVRHLRAQKIISVAEDARTWLNTDGVNLGDLRAKITERLDKLDLAPSDRILATLLIDRVIIGLNDRLVNGVKLPVPPEEFVYQVNTVLAWVVGAARLY